MMKFKAHQSFFIRKGWLSKGIRAIKEDPNIFMPGKSKDAMDRLGLGSNQVVALKYWMLAVGLMHSFINENDKKKCHKLTSFGECIDRHDPYMEETGTLLALHYNLATNKSEATSWYFLFNEFNMKSFTKNNFLSSIKDYIWNNNDKKEIALSSLEADFNCILNTYVSREKLGGKPTSPENVIDCPLGELGILDFDRYVNSGQWKVESYRKRQPSLSSISPLLVLYSILMKRNIEAGEGSAKRSGTPDELSIDELLNGKYSPGKIYNLDAASLLAKLYELETEGYLHIVRTAGLDVIRLKNVEMTANDSLKKYYELIG